MASNFNIYTHKINFAAKNGTNSEVPQYEYTVSNFLHKLVQYGNGFIDEKIKMRYLKLKVWKTVRSKDL
jgi:hypothetical protein